MSKELNMYVFEGIAIKESTIDFTTLEISYLIVNIVVS